MARALLFCLGLGLILSPACSQTCDWMSYRSSSFSNWRYYAPGYCSYDVMSGVSDVFSRCLNSTHLEVKSFPMGSGCMGNPTSTMIYTNSSVNWGFSCGGTSCFVKYQHTQCNVNASMTIHAVPNLRAQNNLVFSCDASGNAYAGTTSTFSSSVPIYIRRNTCTGSGDNVTVFNCSGGTPPPNGGYAGSVQGLNCNWYRSSLTGSARPIGLCQNGLFAGIKAECSDANTLVVGTWLLDGTCSGSATSVQTYTTQGQNNYTFNCGGNSCYLQRDVYPSGSPCPAPAGTAASYSSYEVPGQCTSVEELYYCYGPGNNEVIREYHFSTTTCDPLTISFGSSLHDNFTLPSCSSGSTWSTCVINQPYTFSTISGGLRAGVTNVVLVSVALVSFFASF